MTTTKLIFVSVLVMIVMSVVLEFLISLIHKNYREYVPIERCHTFWSWVYFSWNYIGGLRPVRRIGVRWFGHEWEEEIEIPMGELRF